MNPDVIHDSEMEKYLRTEEVHTVSWMLKTAYLHHFFEILGLTMRSLFVQIVTVAGGFAPTV